MKKLFLLSLVLMITACSPKLDLDGTYKGELNFTFKPNGKVSTMIFGVATETPYEVDGDKIKFHFPGGKNVVLTIQKDGSLDGGLLGKFIKQ